MNVVWIANDAGHPYHKVEDLLGKNVELKSLTMGSVSPLRVDRLCSHLARGIGKFVAEDDFLLISGTPTVNALAVALWLERFGIVKLIQWNASARKYELATLESENLRNLLHFEITGMRV